MVAVVVPLLLREALHVFYEQRIADASTWAYETSTLVRAGLYALVGAASWVGAALVERGLDLLVR